MEWINRWTYDHLRVVFPALSDVVLETGRRSIRFPASDAADELQCENRVDDAQGDCREDHPPLAVQVLVSRVQPIKLQRKYLEYFIRSSSNDRVITTGLLRQPKCTHSLRRADYDNLSSS